MPGEIRVGDVGTVFEFTVKEEGVVKDVSAASVKNIIFLRPDGSVLIRPLSFTTNGADGKVRYMTVAGDLSEAGDWHAQGQLTLPGGSWKTTQTPFHVHPNITA